MLRKIEKLADNYKMVNLINSSLEKDNLSLKEKLEKFTLELSKSNNASYSTPLNYLECFFFFFYSEINKNFSNKLEIPKSENAKLVYRL